MKTVRKLRSETIKGIRALVDHRLRPSGFEPLVSFGTNKDGIREMTIHGAVSLVDFSGTQTDTIMGFVDGGVIVDATGGGMVSQAYSKICLEDLIKILAAVKRLKDKDFV